MSYNFTRQIYKHLFPRWIKNAMDRSIVDLERFHPPIATDRPPGKRVLVLAPHPDDECIGSGGTLCKYVDAGADIRVAVLTDGCQGNPELRRLARNDPARLSMENELVVRRKQETLAALEILGVREHDFLEAKDGALHREVPKIAKKLVNILSEWRPDVVLLPFLTDRHTDHFATNRCFLEAVEQLDASWVKALHCLGYEIWSPIYANVQVDITATMDRKRQALNCYKSQLEHNDYLAGVEGLNRFRAVSGLTGGRYAEAFFHAPLSIYKNIYRNLLL